MNAQPHLRAHFLGVPRLWIGGTALDVTRMQRPLTLLAYLAVESDRPHPREGVASLFWPDVTTSDALRNLRQLLYRLRRALREDELVIPHLRSDSQTLQFDVESSAQVDVIILPRLIDLVMGHNHRRLAICPVCAPKLEAMIALYRGRFLEGWDFSDSPALESWILMTQESLARSVHMALHALGGRHLAHGRYEEALGCAQRLLQFDPWDEVAERLLLRAMVAVGHRNRALQAYMHFEAMLQTELHLPPEDETRALAAAIRAGTGGIARRRAAFPLSTAPLVGREAVLQDLDRFLVDREHRLLTLLGPGGSGKTRLAMHLAKRQMPDWQDGVGVVPLAEVVGEGGTESVVEAMTAVLGISVGPGQPAAEAMLSFLRHREMLLILDNFEHLLPDGALLLRRILQSAPHVKILVTSQARLNVSEEWIVRVEGLALPSLRASDRQGVSDVSESVALFSHHARRVDPQWALTPQNRACVARICHLVEGLPLALELAAVWIRGASACRIADEIASNIDFLQSATPHRPARHQSLTATFAYAYDLLSSPDRALFRRLSVFPSSFLTADAEEVADATLSALARLLDRSLVRLSDADRWDLHPLLCRYISEQLARDPEAFAVVRARHAQTYLNRVTAKADALWGADPRAALADVTAEWENVRAAWGYALDLRAIEMLRMAAGSVARFLDFKGHFQWGVEMFDRAARALSSESSSGSVGALMMALKAHFLMRQADYETALRSAQAALAQGEGGDAHLRDGADAAALALLVMGTVHRHTGAYTAAQDSLSEALEIARSHRLPRLETEILRTLGAVRWRLSDYATASAHYRAALALDRELGDRRGEGWSLNGLGLVAENQGHFGRAIGLYEEALALVEDLGDLWGESIVLGNLGYIYARVGDGLRAREYYRQDLSLCRSLGDRRGESWTQGYLSLLAQQEGRYRVSLRHGRRALTLAREIDHDLLIASALHAIGHAHAGLGEWDDAHRAYRQALALRREAGMHALAMETQSGLILVALGRGETATALSTAEEILAYLDTDTAERTNEHLRIYLAIYRALAAVSDPRARDVLAEARALLEAKAARIENPALRDSYLNQVAVHREIQALAVQDLPA